MLAVARFDVPAVESAEFQARARLALEALAGRPGWRSGRVGRATDAATLWLVVTEWDSVGAYRRALSAFDVKVAAVPLLSLARDEPTAFEVIVATGAGADGLGGASALAADAGTAGPGSPRGALG